jgi:transposase
MHIVLRDAGDRDELDRRIRTESNAKQRDRYRAVRLALDGQPTRAIQAMLGRSKDFVQRWCYLYRDHGVDAITPRKQSGRPPTLVAERHEAFKDRMLAGPADGDGVCTLRGKDAVRILEQEFGARYTLNGAYDLMHRLGLSCLRPRPRHRKNDPEAMAQWLDGAPFLSRTCATRTPANASRSGSRTRPASVSRAR